MGRWFTWQPPQIFKNPPRHAPSKPTKPGFDGFVGSDSRKTQKIDASGSSDSQAPRDAWEWIEERAAIFEFEAGMDRNTANARAFELWFYQFVGYN
jgi:hypothetical protein